MSLARGRIALALMVSPMIAAAGVVAAQDATPIATPIATPRTTRSIDDLIADMPIGVKVGQLIISSVTDAAVGDDSRRIIEDLHIGNIILTG